MPSADAPLIRGVRTVLMTADAVGGVWQYALELGAALGTAGVRVVLATMGPLPGGAQRAEAAAVQGLTLESRGFSLEWMPHPWSEVDAAGHWLLELEDEHTPDVVHVNGFAHGALPWRAPTVVVAHSCVWSWWDAVHHTAPPAEWEEYRQRVSAGLRAARAVVAPSRAMADAIARFYGVRDIRVIPNGRAQGSWPRAAKEPFVLSAGRLWDPAKNITAVDAAARGLPWPVYVCGDASGPGGGVTRLDHAVCVGRQSSSQMRDWMARAAIYALPARYEPFGLSILEAAACGCALVLGDIPSLRENWEGAARFVDPSEPDALRAVLRELIERPRVREGLGLAAARRARSFDNVRLFRGYARCYEELVSTHGRIADSPRALRRDRTAARGTA